MVDDGLYNVISLVEIVVFIQMCLSPPPPKCTKINNPPTSARNGITVQLII